MFSVSTGTIESVGAILGPCAFLVKTKSSDVFGGEVVVEVVASLLVGFDGGSAGAGDDVVVGGELTDVVVSWPDSLPDENEKYW